MQVGQRIRKLRELRNLKQSYMAEALGTTQQTYSRYESGEVEMSVSRLIDIAKILDIRPEEIFMFDEKAMFNYNYWTVKESATEIKQHFNEELIKELKQQYEARIAQQAQEIERLHALLEKSFTK